MTRREKYRENTLEEIKTIARQQMSENGTASISLSAIARVMEISAPALYRYYTSRDDLVTALIVDAYSDLADTLQKAAQAHADQGYRNQLKTVLMFYRNWALAHPVDFQLIYGNPIPGYHAPEDVTTPAARKGFAVILSIMAQAYQSGKLLPPPEYNNLPEGCNVTLPNIEEDPTQQIPALVVYLGVAGWYHIHGMIMLELFHHTDEIISNSGQFYEYEVDLLLKSIGLED
jgi:AcrR family transcriptional regulator